MVKNALAEALTKVANRTPHLGRTHAEHTTESTSIPAAKERSNHRQARTERAKSRIGKKVISGFFDPQASKQLARLAIDRDCTNEDLLREALNDLFTKYHLPPIA